MESLSQRSRQNIAYGETEAYFYILHPEIFNLIEQRRLKIQIRKLITEIDLSLPVLDLGSGTGNIVEKLQNCGVKVVACDISIDMLKQNIAEYKVLCDAHFLPFKDEVFGAITSYSVMHHLSDLGKVILQLNRVSSRAAVLYIDHEPFIDRKERKRLMNDNKRHPFAVFDIINWLMWLIFHPSYLERVVKYLFWGRKKHLRNLKRLNDVETDSLNANDFVEMLRNEGFYVHLIHYHNSYCVKAYRQ